MQERTRPSEKPVDLSELGKDAEGNALALDKRLYFQLLAFGKFYYEDWLALVVERLEEAGVRGALYAEVSDPHGIGLLTFAEDPAFFVETLRPILAQHPFPDLKLKPEYSMFGRTYSIGYERDLAHVLLHKPAERVTDPSLPWAVWYPLRRHGAFEQLSQEEQNVILQEHGGIGRAYGSAGHGYDIRLACHGLDKNDNDFVTGLVSNNLTGISKIVQRMRKTKQTSQYLEHLGPFFVGRVLWQSR